MANVWGFPYKLTANGGGAFLLVYLAFIVIFSYLGLSAEYAIGRRAKTGTIGAYRYSWETVGMRKFGKIIECLPLAGSLCIAIGYAVIISYVMKSLFQAVTGSLMTVNTDTWFNSFAFNGFCINLHHSDRSDFRSNFLVLGYG